MDGISESKIETILATAGYDNSIKFWQVDTGICYRSLIFNVQGSFQVGVNYTTHVNALDIAPDKTKIAAAGCQAIRVFDLFSAYSDPLVTKCSQGNITAVGFLPNMEGIMYSVGEDKHARLWDIRSEKETSEMDIEVGAPINCAYLHPNQFELFVGDRRGAIHIWDLRTYQKMCLIPETFQELNPSIHSIAVDDQATMMAAVSNKGHCYMWALNARPLDQPTRFNHKGNFSASNTYALKCIFSPDSTLLATGSADKSCCIWRTAGQSLLTKLAVKDQGWVFDCAFSADSNYIFTASSTGDNCARLWNVHTGELVKEYIGHKRGLTCLAFRDGMYT